MLLLMLPHDAGPPPYAPRTPSGCLTVKQTARGGRLAPRTRAVVLLSVVEKRQCLQAPPQQPPDEDELELELLDFDPFAPEPFFL